MIKYTINIIFLLSSTINCYSQFLEPGVSVGLNSYSGDLKRGYSPFPGQIGFEVFNRFNISSHQTFKVSYKRGSIGGKEIINDALSLNRDMWFKSKVSEVSGKIEYNFLDYFDEVTRYNFTPYLFFGLGATILKNIEERDKIINSKELFVNIPFGLGFKYLINRQFSIAFELEIKKTFNDNLDYISGANTKNINQVTGLNFNNSVKNYQYGSGNDNDFYYFTGISISYIFYRIPCPKNSAPYNSIY
tara:strand:+ start:441 stop:1178 length:738 start_codon:yes stop_codon:yes gene_type:complete